MPTRPGHQYENACRHARPALSDRYPLDHAMRGKYASELKEILEIYGCLHSQDYQVAYL